MFRESGTDLFFPCGASILTIRGIALRSEQMEFFATRRGHEQLAARDGYAAPRFAFYGRATCVRGTIFGLGRVLPVLIRP
jgi:hypothetical protein